MANDELITILSQGTNIWNKWREDNPEKEIDLSKADLRETNLFGANLRNANLGDANLERANLGEADLEGADLCIANLYEADLTRARLHHANFIHAYLRDARFPFADLRQACLYEADLVRVDLLRANLSQSFMHGAILEGADLFGSTLYRADLTGANLFQANLSKANLCEADLSGSNLINAILVDAILDRANLTNCFVHGVSAWGLKLNGTIQKNLRITPIVGAPVITVDNIEVAQFIYILLYNDKIRHVIDTITSKVVLILGRFEPERKAVLDAIREELRKRDYVPVIFDFDKPENRDTTETVTTLARMARFIIADITDPKSIPLELQAIIPDLAVPVQPLLLEKSPQFSMFNDLRRKYHWVLPVHIYKSLDDLLPSLSEKLIVPAEAKAKELGVDNAIN